MLSVNYQVYMWLTRWLVHDTRYTLANTATVSMTDGSESVNVGSNPSSVPSLAV